MEILDVLIFLEDFCQKLKLSCKYFCQKNTWAAVLRRQILILGLCEDAFIEQMLIKISHRAVLNKVGICKYHIRLKKKKWDTICCPYLSEIKWVTGCPFATNLLTFETLKHTCEGFWPKVLHLSSSGRGLVIWNFKITRRKSSYWKSQGQTWSQRELNQKPFVNYTPRLLKKKISQI